MTYRELALKKALTQVGVREQPAGSNRGPQVDKYQEADSLTNPQYGYPWCASFVNWCFTQVGRPLVELNRSASVGLLLGEARKLGWAHTGTPKPGDLVCFDWDTLTGPGEGAWPDHIGIVRTVGSDADFVAVEGNTSVGNDSNGGQVMIRDRNRSMVEAFIRVPGGYEYKPRYRLTVVKNGQRRVRTGLILAFVLARLPILVKDLARADSVAVLRYRKRFERPAA